MSEQEGKREEMSCPEYGNQLAFQEGCKTGMACGWSACG